METPRMLHSRRYYLGALGAIPAIGLLETQAEAVSQCGMINVQTYGARGDGVTDDTNALQTACNSGQVLFFPKTSAFYKTSHFLDLSNSVYSNGAEIRLAQDATSAKSIFRIIQNTQQIIIDGFILNGLYTTGTSPNEYSAGVDMRSAVNVSVLNNTIKNCFGDNVYVGEWIPTVPCQNIIISNNTLLNPYRNNISVTFADTVLISNNTINKTFNYGAGIDMEPNPNGTDYVKNVTISGNNFDCVGECAQAALNNGIAHTGLLMQKNTATGIIFFRAESSMLSGPMFSHNTFTCKNPAIAPNAYMFLLGNVTSGTLASNIDNTVRAGSYKSVVQYSSTLKLLTNTLHR